MLRQTGGNNNIIYFNVCLFGKVFHHQSAAQSAGNQAFLSAALNNSRHAKTWVIYQHNGRCARPCFNNSACQSCIGKSNLPSDDAVFFSLVDKNKRRPIISAARNNLGSGNLIRQVLLRGNQVLETLVFEVDFPGSS